MSQPNLITNSNYQPVFLVEMGHYNFLAIFGKFVSSVKSISENTIAFKIDKFSIYQRISLSAYRNISKIPSSISGECLLMLSLLIKVIRKSEIGFQWKKNRYRYNEQPLKW